ncbi:hypothetical protein JHD48_04105 [Sulfurimonas sp. SAG-AH-194-I05]|nr:hypothetical protein [Sulfurimonas sp. SAG-AH-194-I05]MDF1874911.1 hypothetical protein [Sulfurimonas sp. SAG-AH-194-I05]
MELKDVILSTLAEMEETISRPEVQKFEIKEKIVMREPIPIIMPEVKQVEKVEVIEKVIKIEEVLEEEKVPEPKDATSSQNELMYLASIKERLLVLFEGFQAPNNTNIEAKIDMTLNFLEYTLATIDSRIETLEKGNT